jgi:putative endonuclease
MKNYYVYIMTNKSDRVIYIGVTNDLVRRVFEHKHKMVKGFTERYNCMKLVHYEDTGDVIEAIKREKQLKNWHRQWKINLVNKNNPEWEDLSFKIGLEKDRDAETSSA